MAAHQAPPSLGFSRQEHWSGWHSLLQGIFPTQGSNPGLPHCRQTLYCLSHREGHRLFYSQGPTGVYKPILTRATQRQHPVFIVLSSGLLPIFWVQHLVLWEAFSEKKLSMPFDSLVWVHALQCKDGNVLHRQCLPAKDHKNMPVVEWVQFTIHCSKGEHTSWGNHVMPSQVSERTCYRAWGLDELFGEAFPSRKQGFALD